MYSCCEKKLNNDYAVANSSFFILHSSLKVVILQPESRNSNNKKV